MRAIRLDPLSGEQLHELDELYHTTHDVRVRTRALMILLAAERQLVASEVAALVRQDAETVRRWFGAMRPKASTGSPMRHARASRPR